MHRPKRRDFIKTALGCAIVMSLFPSVSLGQEAVVPRKPNVVILLIDQP
jgi:hypothetical protein